MMDPLAKMHAGYEPVMPSYIGLLKPPEVAALVEYIKSLRDVPAEGGRAQAAAPVGAAYRVPYLAPERAPEPAGEPAPQAAAERPLPEAPRNDPAQGLPAAGAQIYPPPEQRLRPRSNATCKTERNHDRTEARTRGGARRA